MVYDEKNTDGNDLLVLARCEIAFEKEDEAERSDKRLEAITLAEMLDLVAAADAEFPIPIRHETSFRFLSQFDFISLFFQIA